MKNNENDSKVRPVKLTLPSEKTKYKIIRNTYKLKSSPTKSRIGFKFDLTKQQQAEERALRQELERRKEAEEDVMIYRGKIIKRSEHMRLKNEHHSKTDENNDKPKGQ